MKFENTKVYNFDGALRGMRNPKESWCKSDSDCNDEHCVLGNPDIKCVDCPNFDGWGKPCIPYIGPNDMKLAQQLIRAGSEHRKFLRQIFVCVDITAPLFWWKEFDTYKVGTVANSTSTMHKIASRQITIDSFEIDDYNNIEYPEDEQRDDLMHPCDHDVIQMVYIPYLEYLRKKYLETKDKKVWKELIRWLPEAWLQKRTVTMDYENLLAICSPGQRRFHKLAEWSSTDPFRETFINWARTLPYAQEFIFIDEMFPKCPKQWVLFKDKVPSIGQCILITDGIDIEPVRCMEHGALYSILPHSKMFTYIDEELGEKGVFKWWMPMNNDGGAA